jgi:ATP-binding cassette subfamily F protein 3
LDKVADEQRCLLLKKAEEDRQNKQAQKELKDMKKAALKQKDEKKVRQLRGKEKKVEKSSQLCSAREFGADADEITTKLREDPSLRFRFPDIDVSWDEDTNFLEVDGACVRQGDTVILKKVTLTLEPGSRIAIVGSNGSGKSTLMQALAGALQFEEGPRGRGRKHPDYKPGFVSQNHLESQAGGLLHNCVNFMRDQLPDGENLRGGSDTLTKKSDDSVIRALLGNFGMAKMP